MIGRSSSLKCLMAFILLLNCTYLIAQERVVTGKIKDPSGNPLPGVNVNVWGTRISVTADVTGTFRIPVPSENSVLVFSFVGFLQKEQKVGNDSTFNIGMTYDNADLDQVVVVGYGTSKRRDLTGSVYSVKPGMVTATPVSNAAEALQGRIPGLDITRNNGAPGGNVNIQLRGNRTLSGTNIGKDREPSSPLIIIDGFQGGNLTDLNPNDIESVEVLKDASSTAIYGWMGANGVIIVTTKRGKDRPKVSYNGFYGVNGYVAYPKVRIGDEFIQFRRDAFKGASPTAPDPTNESLLSANELYFYKKNEWVDWLDVITRNATEQSHTASIQSGGDKTKVFFSTGIFKEEGMLRGTDNTRYNARLNYDQRISNMFKAGFMTQLTYTNTNKRQDPMSQISSLAPFGDPYDGDGKVKLWPMVPEGDTYKDPKDKNLLSPITDERPGAYKWNEARGNVIANGYLEITPITGLSLRSNFGTNLNYGREGKFFDSVTLQNYNHATARANTAEITNGFTRFYSWENIVTYNKKFADHNITLTGLSSYTRQDYDESYAYGEKMSNVNYLFYNLDATNAVNRKVNSDFKKTTTFSYAGRMNYTFKGKYLLQATLRADGVSRLSEDNKWDYFPSAGLGWNIHQEDFMKDLYFVNNLKIRATYGVAGNASVKVYETQSVVDIGNYVIGSTVIPVAFPKATDGNADLGWEKSATVNLGLDFALFKSRIFGTIDAYKTKTSDILYLRTMPGSSGLEKQWQNVGESENEGVELALSSVNVTNRDFKWTSTVTFTVAREKITKITSNKNIIVDEKSSLLIGRPAKSWYGYNKIGIWQTDENDKNNPVKFGNYTYVPGDIKVEDRNGDNVIDAINDQGFIGADVPKWYGGLQNTFNYKGLELSVYMVARYGQTINAEFMAGRFNINGSGNGLADFDYWTPSNPTNDFPQPRAGTQWSAAGYTGYNSLNFVDGSFWKVKTVTLAYTLPSHITRKMFSDRVRLYATGNNILTQAKIKALKNYDPERGGSENSPLTRQFVFGANIDF
jgi:TonB-linked SusC/RagA family outer membrane protein